MTETVLPTIENAKAQAKRLRQDLNARGVEIGHGQALEMISHQLGYRDWNTLHAAIGNRPPGPPITVGQRVSGFYLGHPFRGEVLGVRSIGPDGPYRATIRFEEPVNVSAFESFEVLRRQVSATIGRDGRTVERISNGTHQMAIDL
ncbi:MAG: glyoxalase superfamily protein [Minwuia sp.]|uniref:glyoxalase superfamily protein n=1 Tax=Minwuia sp. TaxID=2493630 RepID=UPI003A8378A8